MENLTDRHRYADGEIQVECDIQKPEGITA